MTSTHDHNTDHISEDVGNGWRRVRRTQVVPLYRTGWWTSRWDRLVAWVTRKPRRTVLTSVTSSIYVKGDTPITLEASGPWPGFRVVPQGGSAEVWGAQVEKEL